MKFESEVVHAGDRKRQVPVLPVPSTTPIHLGTTYFYDSAETLDRVLADEEEGFSYSRYSSPTNAALEELVTTLEERARVAGNGFRDGRRSDRAAGRPARPPASRARVARAFMGPPVGLLDRFSLPSTSMSSMSISVTSDALERAIEEKQSGLYLHRKHLESAAAGSATFANLRNLLAKTAPAWWWTTHLPPHAAATA